MNWFRWLIQCWRARGRGTVRRVILLEIVGLEPAAVDRYLEQGLLHYLALLSDIGTREFVVDLPPSFVASTIGNAARHCGVRSVELLPPQNSPSADVESLCLTDRQQQERMIAELSRGRRGVVACVFDLPARLRQLFGPQPDEAHRLMIRDIFARMDEIVGKAHSFVDVGTELFVVIHTVGDCSVGNDTFARGLIFASCRAKTSEIAAGVLPALILERLERASDGP